MVVVRFIAAHQKRGTLQHSVFVVQLDPLSELSGGRLKSDYMGAIFELGKHGMA